MSNIITSGFGSSQNIITAGYGRKLVFIGSSSLVLNNIALSLNNIFNVPNYSGQSNLSISKIELLSDDTYLSRDIFGEVGLELQHILVSISGKNFYSGVIVRDTLYVCLNRKDVTYR